MFARDLHTLLAVLALVGMALVAVEGGVRTLRAVPPGRWASRSSDVLLLLFLATGAGGLALLAGGHRPKEGLHYLYGLLAFGAVPVADSLAGRWTPRRTAMARLAGAVVGLGLIFRLFATG